MAIHGHKSVRSSFLDSQIKGVNYMYMYTMAIEQLGHITNLVVNSAFQIVCCPLVQIHRSFCMSGMWPFIYLAFYTWPTVDGFQLLSCF